MKTDRLLIAFGVVEDRLRRRNQSIWGVCPICRKPPLWLWKPSAYLESHLRSEGYKGEIKVCWDCLNTLRLKLGTLNILPASTSDPPW